MSEGVLVCVVRDRCAVRDRGVCVKGSVIGGETLVQDHTKYTSLIQHRQCRSQADYLSSNIGSVEQKLCLAPEQLRTSKDRNIQYFLRTTHHDL